MHGINCRTLQEPAQCEGKIPICKVELEQKIAQRAFLGAQGIKDRSSPASGEIFAQKCTPPNFIAKLRLKEGAPMPRELIDKTFGITGETEKMKPCANC